MESGSVRFDFPELGVLADEIESGSKGLQVVDEIVANHLHDFPYWFAGRVERFGGESSEQGDVDRGAELSDDVAFYAEPFGGSIRAATVEPFGWFEPVAKFLGVGVEF